MVVLAVQLHAVERLSRVGGGPAQMRRVNNSNRQRLITEKECIPLAMFNNPLKTLFGTSFHGYPGKDVTIRLLA